MKILFMGTPEFAQISLERLINEKFQICGVVTQPDKPKGRGQKLSPPPVKALALTHGISIFQPETLKDGAFAETLAALSPDIIIVVAYGKILPKYILKFPKFGCVNVHASLLPKLRGAAPIHRAIINGDCESGITTMLMDEGLDTGDMLLKRSVEISETTTVGELHDQLATLGADVLLETLASISDGTVIREPQNGELSTYAAMLDRDTGKIDWTKSAREICNLIRGTNPYPGAFTSYNGEKLKIFTAQLGEPINCGTSGEILAVIDGKIHVAAGDGNAVIIEEIQFHGGKKMPVKDYLNGNEIKVGTVLK